jgi:hypothetical protein
VNNTPSELRALDLLMAEKVMGWKKFSGALCDMLKITDGEFIDNGIAIRQGKGLKVFTPTESPADAMMVLKKVADSMTCVWNQGHEWTVSQITAKRISVGAPTLELAICLFAREACE